MPEERRLRSSPIPCETGADAGVTTVLSTWEQQTVSPDSRRIDAGDALRGRRSSWLRSRPGRIFKLCCACSFTRVRGPSSQVWSGRRHAQIEAVRFSRVVSSTQSAACEIMQRTRGVTRTDAARGRRRSLLDDDRAEAAKNVKESGSLDGSGFIRSGVGGQIAGGFKILFEHGGGNLRVELGTKQEHETGDVEPRKQDDDSAK